MIHRATSIHRQKIHPSMSMPGDSQAVGRARPMTMLRPLQISNPWERTLVRLADAVTSPLGWTQPDSVRSIGDLELLHRRHRLTGASAAVGTYR